MAIELTEWRRIYSAEEIEDFLVNTAAGIRAQEWSKEDEEYNLAILRWICDRAIDSLKGELQVKA